MQCERTVERYGACGLDKVPALARAAHKRAAIAAGVWREPNEQEKMQLRRQQAAEDSYAHLFVDF